MQEIYTREIQDQEQKHIFAKFSSLYGPSTLQDEYGKMNELFLGDIPVSSREKHMKKIYDLYKEFALNSNIFVFDNGEVENFDCFIHFGKFFRNDYHLFEKLEDMFMGVKNDGRFISGVVKDEKYDSEDNDAIEKGEYQLKEKTMYYIQEDFAYNMYLTANFADDALLENLDYLLRELSMNDYQEDFINFLKFTVNDKYNQAKNLIFDALGKNITSLMGRANIDRLPEITWLTGGDHAPMENVQARQQALSTYPILSHYIQKEKFLRDIVNQRKPLVPAIAQFFQAEKKNVKRLQGLEVKDISRTNNIIDLHERIGDVLHMPEKSFINGKDHLIHLGIFRSYADHVYNETNSSKLFARMSRNGNPWDHVKRMRESSPFMVNDAIIFLIKKLFLPASFNKIKDKAETENLIWLHQNVDMRHAENRIKKFLIQGMGMKQILDISERYHANIFRYEDILTQEDFSAFFQWEPILGDIDLGDGYRARELHSFKDFKEQGRDQNHCVGGYAKNVLSKCHEYDKKELVFSLEKDGHVESTLDISYKGDEYQASILQNRAFGNARPSAGAQNAANILAQKISHIKKDDFNHYVKNLQNSYSIYREKEEKENKYFLSLCGYNPWDRDMLEKAWDELNVMLPKGMRHLGLDGFIDSLPLVEDIAIFIEKENESEMNLWDKIAQNECRQRQNVIDNEGEPCPV